MANAFAATEGLITLYQLDTGPVTGGPVLYFTSAADASHPTITWGGQAYSALPMEADGFEMTTRGTIPQPTVTISNLFGAGNLLLDTYKGLVGAVLSRILTLRRFLADGSTPDGNAWITWDKFVVAQKMTHTPMVIIFKLAARWDAEGTQLPRRQILRDVCSHSYRVWTSGSSFNYANATCPYAGTGYFNTANAATVASQDQCSRNVRGCQLRFPNQPLPARFFPGVGRVK